MKPAISAGCILAVAIAAGTAWGREPAKGGGVQRAWEKAAKLLVNEAYADFERIRLEGGADAREAELGAALMLLNIQPKTEANIQRAADVFDEIAKSGEDDLSVLAAYYRARVEQVHRFEPDLGKAVALFTDLIQRHPTHPAAQFAVVKRALLEIYDDSPLETKRERLDRLGEAASRLTHPPARRDLHLLISASYGRFFGDDERMLTHLLAADEIGIIRIKSRADVWIRIGELARRTGQVDIAERYYRRFLETYKRDNRHFTIAKRLEALEAPSGQQ